ncbi:MAG: protein-L-isoaspartate O-methyltransferase [Gammaproteobacteria bacterium]|jgi:protein-L-isoaspartate(D-aspartate) O-methyltransferase|nr:protein-L-isoaspartate O-methyltransferase [Gammaproteobacteria bacterium]MDH3847147.1 protein-L-isoaspartate O-methyltransferase [Gammaproteobacteria bacterium]MDH3862517.1 protein-L-isoaspartate O-methyltransferase [Gammaproteobacteria bacterium]MDH3905987.1 protein-L-isoaspartate O-methyltransferase [Gammaproteobacteria bacterium]MDH3908218.1 protein-L-isoaspartate O-methyltransferase [Gammaproteobacteria bacterium]
MNIDFARQQMIAQQVRAWTVLNPAVLEVLSAVPREEFVPGPYESLAFADTEIPLGHGEFMMTPTVEGRVLQALELDRNAHVLEIGTGSGFLTACLAKLSGTLTSVDIHEDFVRSAARKLANIGMENVEFRTMDATRELTDDRYDAIAVTGSIETFDPRFADALRPGGRLFVVVGSPPVMEARLVRRTGDSEWRSENLFETTLGPLVHGTLPPQFVF